ncbi:MAG: EMC3/TMCO1 family protein, partial [Candidatus Woesearchaeota archaeon]|nr:EMC3/TMCO1 family protein [Candidatus Woesearchaeota archaeon]
MVFDRLLDPIFNPLLVLGPLWALVIMSFFISLVIIIIYKYTTDQNLMKQLKEELKEIQKEMKDLKDKPQEAMKVQKRAM